MMRFFELLAYVIELLQREGRVSYRALKREFGLDDVYLEDLKVELIEVRQLAVDQDNKMLIWTGAASATPAPAPPPPQPVPQPAAQDAHAAPGALTPVPSPVPDAERHHVTVLFCDLVDSTRLAGQLDPGDWREVVRAYQQTGTEVVQRFDGHVAQLLDDGLLVYFGWPQAHEDDALRAVRTGLGLLVPIYGWFTEGFDTADLQEASALLAAL
jgi:Adenylate and Guanylate cyclase catalytic domain